MATLSRTYWRDRASATERLLPIVAIEGSVVDGFAEVCDADVFAFGEVGDGAADAKDFVVSAGGQAHIFHRLLQE